MKPVATTRLYALLAREADRAVVFRRGPSDRVLLVAWDTARDRFTEGQWLRGRIYERRADLSPSGERLVYFAAQYRRKEPTWTAVSKPPWLTALALWKNPHGAWGGGGLFATERKLLLNQPSLKADQPAPGNVKVELLGPSAGRGEDFPIWEQRLARDGWRLIQPGEGRTTWRYDPPRVWARDQPGGGPALEMRLRAIGGANRPWYEVEHALVAEGQEEAVPGAEWADWDRSGDLLYAAEGRLYRAGVRATREGFRVKPAKELVDLRGATWTSRPPPRGYGWW